MMGAAKWVAMIAAVGAVSCSRPFQTETGTGGDADTDTDTDTDVDTDVDTDTDTDTDTTEPPIVDCRADYATPVPGSIAGLATCQTGELFCGDFIQATTVGGSTHYDETIYEPAGAGTSLEDWSAPERVYAFRQPVNTPIRVSLYSPCRDINILLCLGWECSDANGVSQSSCNAALEFDADGARFRDLPGPTSGPRNWELIVDGQDGDSGNFALRVECF